MRFHRVWSMALLVMSGGWQIGLAQQADENVSPAERAYIASRIYSSITCDFAHRAGVPDLDIDCAYRTYLPKALAARDRREFDLATLEFVARLRNKHTQFSDQWLNRNDGQALGFQALPIDGHWLITASSDARLKRGDSIRAIDGTPIEVFARNQVKYIAASSERSARSLVFERPYLFPRSFTLELERGSRIVVERSAAAQPDGDGGQPPASEGRWIVQGSVGYIKIPGFNHPNFERTALQQVERFRAARSLIVDVRGNGGGSTPGELMRALMNREWRDWTTSTPARLSLYRAQGAPPAEFVINSTRYHSRPDAFRGRLILLVDRFTCSACEDFVMPFKDNGRATIIGETTEGSSGQPYFHDLGNGMTFMVGAARHAFPDGSPFESVGIEPAIRVERHIEDIRGGLDPVFEKARAIADAR